MATITFYTIHISMTKPAPAKVHFQEYKREMFLSANGAISGPQQCQLDSQELAEEFLSAYMPRLRKRYGDDVKAEVVPCVTISPGASSETRLKAKIELDSKIARKRLETGILASNVKIEVD